MLSLQLSDGLAESLKLETFSINLPKCCVDYFPGLITVFALQTKPWPQSVTQRHKPQCRTIISLAEKQDTLLLVNALGKVNTTTVKSCLLRYFTLYKGSYMWDKKDVISFNSHTSSRFGTWKKMTDVPLWATGNVSRFHFLINVHIVYIALLSSKKVDGTNLCS